MTTLIAYEHNGKLYASTPQELCDEISYASYVWNRRRNPEIPTNKWAIIYGEKSWAFEQRFQQETSQ